MKRRIGFRAPKLLSPGKRSCSWRQKLRAMPRGGSGTPCRSGDPLLIVENRCHLELEGHATALDSTQSCRSSSYQCAAGMAGGKYPGNYFLEVIGYDAGRYNWKLIPFILIWAAFAAILVVSYTTWNRPGPY